MMTFFLAFAPLVGACVGFGFGRFMARRAAAKSIARDSSEQVVGDFPLVSDRGRFHG